MQPRKNRRRNRQAKSMSPSQRRRVRPGLRLEQLEDRRMLALVAPVSDVGTSAKLVADVLDTLPPPINEDFPPQFYDFLEFVEGTDLPLLYQAFPGEVNEVQVFSELGNALIMINESDDVTMFRLPPAFGPKLYEDVKIDIGGAGEAGGSFVGHLAGQLGIKLSDFPTNLFQSFVSVAEVDTLVPNGSALLDLIPQFSIFTDAFNNLLDFKLPGIELPGPFTIPKFEIPAIVLPKLSTDLTGTIIPETTIFEKVKIWDELTLEPAKIPALGELESPTSLRDILDILPEEVADLFNKVDEFLSFLRDDYVSDSIYVSTLDGPDTIDLSEITGVPQQLYAGSGDDTIIAGGGQNYLDAIGLPFFGGRTPAKIEVFGEAGNDVIVVDREHAYDQLDFQVDGGPGNDILQLEGTEGNDIFRVKAVDGILVEVVYERPNIDGTVANEKQVITMPLGVQPGSTFTLDFDNGNHASTSGAIPFDASAATLQSTLEAMTSIGTGNVEVTGNDGGPWTVEFIGDLGSANHKDLAADGENLIRSFAKLSIRETRASDSTNGTDEEQQITLPAEATGGTFTLTFDGHTTGEIAAGATASDVDNAFIAAGIPDADIRVFGLSGGPWTVEFKGTLQATDQPLITGSGANLVGGPVTTATETQAVAPAVNQVQRLTLPAGVTGGYFSLVFDDQFDETNFIAFNASAADIQTALENLNAIEVGDVVVTGNPGGPWDVEFKGAFSGANQTLLTANSSNLAGGVTLNVAETTMGTGTNEVQTITVPPGTTSGTFQISDTLQFLDHDAMISEVQTALESRFGAGNVNVTQDTGTSGGPWHVEFRGLLAATDVPAITFVEPAIVFGPDFIPDLAETTKGAAGATEVQTITPVPADLTGGSFTLSFGGATTNAIPFDADGGTVELFLGALPTIGFGNISVVGPEEGPWTVTFDGLLGDQPLISADTTNLAGALSIAPATQEIAAVTSNEKQSFSLPPTTGGSFTLTFANLTTTSIAHDAAPAAVQSALESLGNIGAGNVEVTGSVGDYVVEFTGALSAESQPELIVDGSALIGAVTPAVTEVTAGAGTNEIQTLTLPQGVAAGSFSLTFDGQSTGSIPYTADAAALQTALESLANIDPGDIEVTGASQGPWAVEFAGQYAAQDVPEFTATVSFDVMGGTIAVSETVHGSDGNNEIIKTTRFTNVDSIEQLHVDGGGGDDTLILEGIPEFPLGIFFDAADETDFIVVNSDHPNPHFVRPIFPDGIGAGTGFVAGQKLGPGGPETFLQSLEMTGLEGGITFDAGGRIGSVELHGNDEGNELRFDGTGPGQANYQMDSEATVTMQNFAAGSSILINGDKGDDVITISPQATTQFSSITVDGGELAEIDEIRLEGTTGNDFFTFQPGGSTAQQGRATINVSTAIDYLTMETILFLGLDGDDTLTVQEPVAGANDEIHLFPGLHDEGELRHTAVVGGNDFVYAPIIFESVENRNFATGTGSDTLILDVGDIPGVNNAFVLSAASGTPADPTTIDFGEIYTWEHDTTDADTLSMEVGSAADQITVNPGAGTNFAINTSFDSDLLTYNAGNGDVVWDTTGKRLSQTGTGDVTYTSVETVGVNGGTGSLTVNGSGGKDRFFYEPLPNDSGRLAIAGDSNHYSFSGVGGALTIDFNSAHDDEVIVEGTGAADLITASAVTRTVTVNDSTGTALKPVILGSGIDIVTIHSNGAADTILVSPDPGAGGLLLFNVAGGSASDRLVVEDQGIGNTIRHHQGADQRSGSVHVGLLPPVSYEEIEFIDILPLDPVTGAAGSDGLGRVVVFHPDTFSQNDSRLNATDIADLLEHTAKPNISPGGQANPFGLGFDLPGDEDWYEFRAPHTGTFRFDTLFESIGTLANGQPGLPGAGALATEVYDSTGVLIASGINTAYGARVTFGIEHYQTIFLRVKGATTDAVNTYDVNLVEVDTLGPEVTDVRITGSPTFDLFDPKPATFAPTPRVESITVSLQDLVARAPGFVYAALDPAVAANPAHYALVGDHNGAIAITGVTVINASPVAGVVPTAAIELQFHGALADDRYTLTISDSIVDPAGNALNGPWLGRFAVDTRPEIATYVGDGTWYIDLNGNGVFDPANTDATNRDIVWKFGQKDDKPVVGDWNGDGFDQIGVYGKRNGKHFFQLDLDGNGTFDAAVDANFEFKNSKGGDPVAGDWDGDGRDELAVKKNQWYVDQTGVLYTPALTNVTSTKINNSMDGSPIAGDWDGDGTDTVGTFTASNNGGIDFFLDVDGDFADSELTVDFFIRGELDANSVSAVAGDWDMDGDDDLGAFVSGEWYLDINTDLSAAGSVVARFEPPPTGLPGLPLVDQDIFFNFNDARGSATTRFALAGNFDPPPPGFLAEVFAEAGFNPLVLPWQNQDQPLDVNDDDVISPLDALNVQNKLDADGSGRLPIGLGFVPDYFADTSGDGRLSPIDMLLVVNHLNLPSAAAESESVVISSLQLEGEASVAATALSLLVGLSNAPNSSASDDDSHDQVDSSSRADPGPDAHFYALARIPSGSHSSTRGNSRDAESNDFDAALEDMLEDIAHRSGDLSATELLFASL